MTHTYNKGSEWRKWDLHVHTPESLVHHFKGKDEVDVWEQYIRDIESLPSEIKVLGINDYLFIDGYRKILEYKEQGRMSNIALFLPVIEFRLARFSGHKQLKRINFHVIFSEKISPDIIQHQFLNGLSNKYKLNSESNQDAWGGVITRENLEQLGKSIINSVPANKRSGYGIPLIEGFNNLNLEVDDIRSVLANGDSYFKDKYITAIGKTEWDCMCWDDGSITEKKTIINNVDIVFTAAESIENYTKGRDKLIESRVNSRLLDCSDAHNNIDSPDKDRLGNCWTWIKADTTFEGLKQIICEPEDRIKVQVPCPDEKKSYNIIDKVRFVNDDEKRFSEQEIGFSSGLNAIIGGKSSGKSLLLHMIANEIGNGVDIKNYSQTIGGSRIEVYYKDDNDKKRTRDDNRIIEFLPQLYIENIVRDKSLCKNSKIRSFNEFIEGLIKQDVEIDDIIRDYKNSIEQAVSNIDLCITEWTKLDTLLYNEKMEFSKLGDKTAILNEIKKIGDRCNELTKSAGWTECEKVQYNELVDENKKNNENKSNFINTINDLRQFYSFLSDDIERNINKTISYNSNNDEVNEILYDFKSIVDSFLLKSIKETKSKVAKKGSDINLMIEKIEKKIADNEEKLRPLLAKNTTQREIAKCEKQLKDEKDKLDVINAKMLKISELKNKIYEIDFIGNYRIIYNSYYELAGKLNDIVAKKWNIETTKLSIMANAIFDVDVFGDSISSVINMKSYLSNQFPECKFECSEYKYDRDFHIQVVSNLINICINEENRFNNFKAGRNTKEILTAILKDCFTIDYDIIKGKDSLKNMSEGKKGIVVLQLYLSLSKSDCPILIDQPEDNLDNRTVYQELNDYIKKCKQRRQIIMVSHNANLVVNTDAENIIVANQSGEDGEDNQQYRFEYVNGSLENTFINNDVCGVLYKQGIREHVCEILEGGTDAFKKREEKYHINN